MPKYLLRVEGVNQASVIEDTDDLSTRRGGGLMILNAARQLISTLPSAVGKRLSPIATGASIGLYKFQAEDDNEAEQLAQAVRVHFQEGTLEYVLEDGRTIGHLELKHGTFVVDVEALLSGPAQGAAVERTIAKNRWRQVQEPAVALSGLWFDEAADNCVLDFVRPGVLEEDLPENRRGMVSVSVKQRRRYGRLRATEVLRGRDATGGEARAVHR